MPIKAVLLASGLHLFQPNAPTFVVPISTPHPHATCAPEREAATKLQFYFTRSHPVDVAYVLLDRLLARSYPHDWCVPSYELRPTIQGANPTHFLAALHGRSPGPRQPSAPVSEPSPSGPVEPKRRYPVSPSKFAGAANQKLAANTTAAAGKRTAQRAVAAPTSWASASVPTPPTRPLTLQR
jgi:hypothetical protein